MDVPETAAAPAVAVADPVVDAVVEQTATETAAAPPVEPSLADEIAALNEKILAEETGDEVETEAEAAEEGTAVVEAEQPAETAPIVFSSDDAPDVIQDKVKQVLEGYDLEQAPEIKGLIEFQQAQLAERDAKLNEFSNIANPQVVVKVASALSAMLETDLDPATGQTSVKVEPLINLLREDYTEEFKPIAEAALRTPSTRYEGANLFEELLIDEFGIEKAQKMVAYGTANIPLPVMPANLALPEGVDERFKEAYFRLPEVKKFDIEGLVSDISQLEKDIKDSPDYLKTELATKHTELRSRLDAELHAIENTQKVLDGERAAATRLEQERIESNDRFHRTVFSTYTRSLVDIEDAFAQELAPKLTYADADTQLSQARNIMTRISNAFSFEIRSDGTFQEDPAADRYAKQLAEEGVKYDFAQGRRLLQSYYKATATVEALKERKAGQARIDYAQGELDKLRYDVKTEERVLLGQLTQRYVKSNGQAMAKQVAAVREKKQIARTPTSGRFAAPPAGSGDVDKDLAAYNRRIRAGIASGEDLYEAYQS